MGPNMISALQRVCEAAGVDEWGAAANRGWPLAPDLPFAITLAGRHAPDALSGLEQTHMSKAFFDDYARLWRELDDAAAGIVAEIEARGHVAVQSSNLMTGPHDDPPVDDWGDPGVFSHKIAATQAGLGWIGKTAVYVSARFGAAVRLTTVFTDLPLPAGLPITESRCGTCRICVDACPMNAGRDALWTAGMPREQLYDEKACEAKTYEHPEWDGTCGVCQAVCPYTVRGVRREPWRLGEGS